MAVNTEDPYAPDAPDSDPTETAEWQESLDDLTKQRGPGRAREIMTSPLARRYACAARSAPRHRGWWAHLNLCFSCFAL